MKEGNLFIEQIISFFFSFLFSVRNKHLAVYNSSLPFRPTQGYHNVSGQQREQTFLVNFILFTFDWNTGLVKIKCAAWLDHNCSLKIQYLFTKLYIQRVQYLLVAVMNFKCDINKTVEMVLIWKQNLSSLLFRFALI